MGVGSRILKSLAKRIVFLVLSGKKNNSPLFPTLEKCWKNLPVAPSLPRWKKSFPRPWMNEVAFWNIEKDSNQILNCCVIILLLCKTAKFQYVHRVCHHSKGLNSKGLASSLTVGTHERNSPGSRRTVAIPLGFWVPRQNLYSLFVTYSIHNIDKRATKI